MTCKLSLCKSIKETIKHHLASVFAVCLLFFLKLTAFFLQVQNYATGDYNSDKAFVRAQLNTMTLPDYATTVFVSMIALFLAFDFFRYLHSKKQTDFFEALPIRRKDTFVLRILSICIVFAVPFILCHVLELGLLGVFHFFQIKYLINILWTFACMMLIFLIILLTCVLAMVMTGHPVIALLGFGVFSSYVPIIIQYIFPSYASQYFETYSSPNDYLSEYLTYVSPIGAAIKLVRRKNYVSWSPKEHVFAFIAILVLIILVGILDYVLFKKRPAEAAGRAMAFTKCNPVIRILLVIPLTLYIGLYFSQVATVGNRIWMIFGFAIGTLLLHGIIESIFQFDIRGLWSHKKQMIGCFVAAMAVALVFWTDFFHYDEYLPEKEELEAVAINFNDYFDTSKADGVSGEYLDAAYQLVQNIVSQQETLRNARDNWDTNDNTEIYLYDKTPIKYYFKNGTVKERLYIVDKKANMELIDKIYATKEYKDDICELYRDDWTTISDLTLSDSFTEVALNLTQEEKNVLFQTYLAEYTPFTYSQKEASASVVHLSINKYRDKNYRSTIYNYNCYVYPQFTQTIALLDKYVQQDKSIQHFGTVSGSPMEKYTIRSMNIIFDDAPMQMVEEADIGTLKEQIELYDYDCIKTTDFSECYEVTVEFSTSTGIVYANGIIPKEIADQYKK